VGNLNASGAAVELRFNAAMAEQAALSVR